MDPRYNIENEDDACVAHGLRPGYSIQPRDRLPGSLRRRTVAKMLTNHANRWLKANKTRSAGVTIVRIYTHGFYSAWPESVPRSVRTSTLSSNILSSSTFSIKACYARPLRRPQICHPGVYSLSRTGAGKSYSSIEGVSFCLSILTRVRNSFEMLPYTRCSNYRCDAYTHAGLALAEA